MRHLGDITKISGHDAPVVDVVIGGSPCQDLSVAGKRAGLAGERSGLYMEQIRIIKEMREHDRISGRTGVDIRPRYMVWENVPGAFSSNGGKDFAAVLEEAIRTAEPEAPDVPVPPKGWPTSGCIRDVDGRWSVAWRVLDAQFWGVPQRRRRIALVADFGGQSASEILFVRKSVSRDIEPGESKGKETAGDAGEGSGGTVGCDIYNGSLSGDKAVSLNTDANATGAGPTVICVDQGGGKSGAHSYEDVSPTLTCTHGSEPAVVYGIDQQGGKGGANFSVNVSPPILSDSHGTPHAVCYNIGSYHSNAWKSDNPHSGVYKADKSKTLDALQCGYPGCNQGGTAVVEPASFYPQMKAESQCFRNDGINNTLVNGTNPGFQNAIVETFLGNGQTVVGILMANAGTKMWLGNQEAFSGAYHIVKRRMGVRYNVRRLTPLECERLQGFPDGWTDIGEWVDSKGKKHKEADSPRYKALGNSIAIPPWKWVLKRLCACYERDATMASLFDGIGGFPYIWEQLNGKGSCLWASEIEEYPMAVTKLRFGGNDNA